MFRERGDRESTDRAVSSVLGFILIVSMVVTVSVGILLVGMDGVDRAQSNAETSSVEYTMSELNSQASLVALDSNERTRTVDLGAAAHGNAEVVDDGRIIVEVNYAGGPTETVMNETMGAIKYTNPQSGDVVTFQGGGVWKKTEAGASMVSPPEFHYRDSTLTLPAMMIDTSASSVNGQYVTVERTDVQTMYPTAGDENPIENGEITITVESEYYEAWGTFFEERTESKVTYDHANDRVEVLLVTELETETITSGVASTSPGDLTLTSTNDNFTDGYNSSDQPVPDDPDDYNGSGDIVTRGDVIFDGNAEMDGDLISGGTIDFQSNGGYVDGNISYTVACDEHSSKSSCEEHNPSDKWVNNNASVPDIDAIDPIVKSQMESIKDDNDGEFDLSDKAGGEIDAGTYYVNDGNLSDESIDLNTSDGNITLAIEGDIDWSGSSTDLNVTHPEKGNVVIYTNASSVALEGEFGDNATKRSTAFWLYGKEGLDVTFRKPTDFVGVVYAPSADASQGDVLLENDAVVHGAVVAGGSSFTLDEQAHIYFDEAVANTDQPLSRSTAASTITYIHVTKNTIKITEE